MNNRLMRLLRIIYLIQFRPGIKAKELANECETTERTIYRDLQVITSANIPITSEGHSKGYKFIGNFKIYPINWNEDEFKAFTLIPSILKNEYLNSSFYTAYEKVMATHSAHKLERKGTISNITDVLHTGQPSNKLNSKNYLPEIIESILSSKKIDIVYHTQSRDITTRRIIDPYYLLPRNHHLYFIGYCHKSNELRTFRVSRILELTILDEKFTGDNVNLNSYMENTWSIIRGNRLIKFKVIFNKNVARYIKEEELFITPIITERRDGSILFEVTINDDREFLQWVMQYGPNAEIIEPIEYRVKMKELLKIWSKKY